MYVCMHVIMTTGMIVNSDPSPQHVDVASLLIKHNSSVNALDRWNFTPLHEAAQKGRTQLCSLLILHGADVSLQNQEGQTAYDVATVRTG